MQIHHIEYDKLLAFADGDVDFVHEMLNTFVTNTPLNIEKIRQFFDESNWHQLAVELHKIKPTYKYLFVSSVEELLKSSEELCEENPTGDKLPINLEKIESITKEVITEAHYLLSQLPDLHS